MSPPNTSFDQIKKPFSQGKRLDGHSQTVLNLVSLRWYYPGQVRRVYSQASKATPNNNYQTLGDRERVVKSKIELELSDSFDLLFFAGEDKPRPYRQSVSQMIGQGSSPLSLCHRYRLGLY